MKIEIETRACPLCGQANHTQFLQAPDRFNPEGGYSFRIAQCTDCGFVYLNPRPIAETIGQFYQDEAYQPFLSTLGERSLWDRLYEFVRSHALRGKRNKIERLQKTGRLLDVGCGTGEFLDEMQRHGWQVAGMEKDEEAAQFAGKNYGLAVQTRLLQECEFDKASFDVITFWHVLEHVYDPIETLNTAKSLLKPDGLILIAMPNIHSFDARFYGQHWVALDTPRHLLHFTPDSVAKLCDVIGLRLLGVRQMVLDAFYNCILSEQLRLTMKKKTGIRLLPAGLRAGVIATLSVANACRFWRSQLRNGSSNLYVLAGMDCKVSF